VVRPQVLGPGTLEGTTTLLIAVSAGVGVAVALLLLASRNEAGIVRLWQTIRSPGAAFFRETLDARLDMHELILRDGRRRTREAAAQGTVIQAAELGDTTREYARKTRNERQGLARAKRMLSAIRQR
jgi:hypothetical protein